MRTCEALATATATYCLPLLILLTTSSAATTGAAFALEWTPRLATFPFAGTAVDRWGAARVFRTANTARTVLVAAAALALLYTAGNASAAAVMVLGSSLGVLAEVSFVAAETLGAEVGRVRAEQGHRVQAVQTAIDQGALIAGPLLGGMLLLTAPSAMLAAIAALGAGAALIGPRYSSPPQPAAGGAGSGWRSLRRAPLLMWLVAGLTASNLASAVLQAAAPITVVHGFGMPAAAVGVLWSGAAAATLVAIAAARWAIGRWTLWPVGACTAVVSTVACAGVALAPGFTAYAVAVGVLMAAEGALTVVLRTLRAQLIPADGFGATLAATIVILLLPLPAAGVLVAVVPAADLQRLLLACAFVQGLVLGACFNKLRSPIGAELRRPPP